jgi:O-antigen/teichoic acid export membrane protein
MRNNGVIAAAQIVWQSLAMFAVYRIAAHGANSAILGLWSTGVAVMSLVTFADAGLTDIMVRQVSKAVAAAEWRRLKGLCGAVLLLVAVSVGLAALLAILPVANLLHALTPTLPKASAVMLAGGAAALVWLTTLVTGTSGVLEAFGRYDLKALAAFIGSSVAIVVAWGVSRVMPQAALVIGLVGAAIVNMAALLIALLVLFRRFPGSAVAPRFSELKDMVRIGVPARVAGLANLGLDPVIRFLILRFGGTAASVFYELASRLVVQLRGVLVAVTQVMVPRLVQARTRGEYDEALAISALTQSSIRIASPALWLTLLLLPLLSAAVLGKVEPELLAYGLMLAVAWLINVVTVPAYYGNFIEGKLHRNRFAHLVILLAVPLLGFPGGLLWGGLGVVAGAALAICGGSMVNVLSRGRGLADMHFVFNTADAWIAALGLLVSTGVYAVALAAIPTRVQVVISATALIAYLALVGIPLTRLAREHVKQLSG